MSVPLDLLNSDLKRIASCKSQLREIIGQGLTLQTPVMFLEASRHWLGVLERENQLTSVVLDRCEMFLEKRGEGLDELDMKILEIKSEWETGHWSSWNVHEKLSLAKRNYADDSRSAIKFQFPLERSSVLGSSLRATAILYVGKLGLQNSELETIVGLHCVSQSTTLDDETIFELSGRVDTRWSTRGNHDIENFILFATGTHIARLPRGTVQLYKWSSSRAVEKLLAYL